MVVAMVAVAMAVAMGGQVVAMVVAMDPEHLKPSVSLKILSMQLLGQLLQLSLNR